MSKHKHRRTQSNSEVDLRNALCQQDDKKHFIEIFNHASHIQPQIPEKEVIIEKLEDDYAMQHLKENCGLTFGNSKKKSNFGSYQPNNLFLIPEQNDLLSSVEQTQESGKKLTSGMKLNVNTQKRQTNSVEQKNNNDQKENLKNEHNRQNSTLISQIQAQLRDVTHLMNSDKLDLFNKMSFTKELQKKTAILPVQVPFSHQTTLQPSLNHNYSQQQQSQSQHQQPSTQLNNNILQQQNPNIQPQLLVHQNSLKNVSKHTITPDRKRTPSMAINKPSGIEAPFQKSDKSINESEKPKNNLSVSIFNNLFQQNKKISISHIANKPDQQNDSFRKLETQMKKIERELMSLKQRQDQQDEINKTIQQQLQQVIHDSRKQREQGHLSLKKLEQLEMITRRNEESIMYLRQTLGGHKRMDSMTHQTDSTELSDQHRRFTDLKSLNRYI
ncbi:unnamed protein product (macronuclear) [Paramecium tetraurelia]|uniref:Uncharacterized protein n=1 Tax=Paramecium tetraurelia TaxID=5888 RepID=A0BEB8_PARTE|nr:uncharacterized protein GSPATT00027918001 [Paramecium tetraurelia]CAK56885.1 unnamed protein product [Paramecium tetraurelia]|eukprot:XP_001424283.1 hypothetical protein (macronuclear) [Paramecium tetraurelia strain d4-2]